MNNKIMKIPTQKYTIKIKVPEDRGIKDASDILQMAIEQSMPKVYKIEVVSVKPRRKNH